MGRRVPLGTVCYAALELPYMKASMRRGWHKVQKDGVGWSRRFGRRIQAFAVRQRYRIQLVQHHRNIMAISLKNAGFLFVEENDCIRQALSMLKDGLFGINVEFCEKLITSALETYLVDKILCLPQRTIEQTYYLLYEAISKHQECKMLTGVTDITMADTVVAVDSVGFTQQEEVNIFKMAASLMQLSQMPGPRKDIYGLKFLYFMEDMLKLMGAMRMCRTPSMFMMSSEVMMPGSA